MYKKFFMSVLSFVSLTTIVHAGRLELTADLSEEQKTAINKRFVEPYQEEYSGTAFQGMLEKCWIDESIVSIRRPYISPLKEMSFRTILVSDTQLNEAELIASTYIKIASNSGETKVSTTPVLNNNEGMGAIAKK